MKKLLVAAAVCVVGLARAATTGDYVQSGLIACWDGWENDGTGGHATTLTEWKDTSGAHPFAFNTGAGIEVRPFGLYFPGNGSDYATLSAADTASTFNLCSNGVLEVCMIAEKAETLNVLLQSTTTAGIAFVAGGKSSGSYYMIVGTNKSKKYLYNWTTGGFSTYSLCYQFAKNESMHQNDCEIAPHTDTTSIGNSKGTAFLGIDGSKKAANAYQGTVYSIRLYEAPLTEAQRMQNKVMDEMRFTKGDVYPLTGVYVRGEPQDYGEADSLGYGFAAKTAGDAIELTAPEYVEISASERAYCTGWKLYDRATGDLIGESTDETRRTFALTYKKPVRLDWQWDVRHQVTVSAADGLTVTPEAAWGSAATPAEFTVEGADFPLWSGDGLVSECHAKTALFAPTNATAATVAKAAVREPADLAGLQAAIASSENGDVIVLPAGTNSFADATSESLTIAKAVLVTSRSGDPKDVAVDLGGTGWGFTLTAAGARLKGITFISSVDIKEDSKTHPLPRFVNVVTGTVDTCVFRDINITGARYGGFAPVCLAPDGVIDNCVFTNIINKVAYMSAPYGTVNATGGLITRTKFFRCDTYLAPVISAGPSNLTVEDCLFTGYTKNTEDVGQYSGVYGTTPFTVRRSVFADNSTMKAVICLASGSTLSAWIEDCVFSNNVSRAGSGVFVLSGRGGPIFNRCIMEGNTGSDCGVVKLASYCYPALRNCLIRGNTGTSTAGAVYGAPTAAGAHCIFENCTVTGNKTVNGAYPGIAIAGAGNPSDTYVKNCIVYGNGQGEDASQLLVDEDRVFSSCYPEAAEGNANGNTAADPQLLPDGTLKYTSPCLDAGRTLSLTAGALDLAGTVRPQNGTRAAVSLWDMGCFEMPPNSATLQVSIVLDRTVGTTAVTATAKTSGTDLTGLVYNWTVTRTTPSGSTDTEYKGLTAADLVLENLAPGTYSFSVVVKNASGDEEGATCDDTFAAKTPVCFVSTTGSATWPYDEPAKATPLISEAIGNAAARVEIAAGEYDVAETGTMTDFASGDEFMMVVESPIEVVGAGPGLTKFKLDGAHAAICVANAGASVSGIGVCGAGRTDASFNGSSLRLSSGTASNIVVNGSVTWGSGVAVGPNALLTCCVVTNVAQYSDKDCVPVTLCCGTISDTVIAGCTGRTCGGVQNLSPTVTTHAQIVRSKIVGNKATNGTGGLHSEFVLDVTDTDIIGNDSTAGNGGSAVAAKSTTLTNCRIIGNRIYGTGGALGCYAWSFVTAVNVLVADNVSGGTGNRTGACRGVEISGDCAATFRNCTVTGNVTTRALNAGVSVGAGENVKTFVNCLFWGNSGTNGVGSANFSVTPPTGKQSTPVIQNCCWPEAAREDGNTPDDPKFRTVKRYRHYPSPTGSCYETGDKTGWTDADVDLAGQPRLRDGKVDIGCFQIPPLSGLMLLLK